MTVETAGVPAHPGESAPTASTADATPEATGLALRVVIEASGTSRDGTPARFRCEKDDGTPAHLALIVETPVGASSFARVAKLRCGCGSSLALVLGARG
jgi:hypothetical protein